MRRLVFTGMVLFSSLAAFADPAAARTDGTSAPLLVAVIGLLGAVIGSVATVSIQVLMFYLEQRAKAKADQPRKRLLLTMLRHPDYPWRTLDTLMHVIGADEESTKRLLLEIGARASEDGQRKWALLERKPLHTNEQ
jgi:hypothetical protein